MHEERSQSTQSQGQRSSFSKLRHDLRTPINAIIGYAEMLLEDLAEQGETQFIIELQQIQSSGKLLLSLINTILDPELVEVTQGIPDLNSLGASLRMGMRSPINAVLGYCDLLLEQIEPDLKPDIEKIRTATRNLRSMLHLIGAVDNFPETTLTTLPMQATSQQSESPLRASLTETISLSNPPRSDNYPTKKTTELVNNKGCILVVDDNADNRDLLTQQLQRQQYTVATAANGLQALQMVAIGNYDLILLDVMMPEIDGYEVLQQLKADERWRHIPVIMISALDDIESVVRCIEKGAEDYLSKPFSPVLLRARIGACLEKKQLRDQEFIYLNQLSQAHNEITTLNQRLASENNRLNELNEELKVQITERQKAEEKYRSIFENAVEGIYQITPAGYYLSANPALARIYGYDSPETLIAELTDIASKLYVSPDRWQEFTQAIAANNQAISSFESQAYRRDGQIIWISENARSVHDSQGNLIYYEGIVENITKRKKAEADLRQEKERSERLLLNILPKPVAEQLKKQESLIADRFENVTILFADLVDFSGLSLQLQPRELVQLLNEIFSTFDQLAEAHELEKIKTIGDAYMVVAGAPLVRADHASAIAEMAIAMQTQIQQFQRHDGQPFYLRVGINTGPVVAGVIGLKKFTYDLWGDTVNVASRMESQGVIGKIQVTETSYHLLKQTYHLEPRGIIEVKGRGPMPTYFLSGKR